MEAPTPRQPVPAPSSRESLDPLLVPAPLDADEARLHQLGYKQELRRDLGLLMNFAFSFSIISIMTGITGTFGSTGLMYGGPVGIVYGWLLVSFFDLMVGLAMSEICSAYPTSGGLYFWSFHLAGPRWGPLASWITGWFALLGQIAVTGGVAFTLANLVAAMVLLATGGGGDGGGHVCSVTEILGLYGGILLVQGLLNTFSLRLLTGLQYISVAWNSLGVLLVVVLLPLVATRRQSWQYVFTHFETANAEAVGITNPWYILGLGLLMAQYTIGGYDASAHMAEETQNASVSGPAAIVVSIATSVFFGLLYILSMLFSISDPSWVIDPKNDAGGYAAAQIYFDAFKQRTGSGNGGIILLLVPAGAMFFCGLSCVTGNSRMLYAFSRDGAVPFSRLWHYVDPHTQNPVYAVWAMVGMAFALGLPMLYDVMAFNAIISISAIGLYISYAIPIFLRTSLGRSSFKPGPFHLGRFSPLVCWLACGWVALITILFCLPTVYPVALANLNYAPLAVAAVLVFCSGWWMTSAGRWFKGPVTNLTLDDGELSAPLLTEA